MAPQAPIAPTPEIDPGRRFGGAIDALAHVGHRAKELMGHVPKAAVMAGMGAMATTGMLVADQEPAAAQDTMNVTAGQADVVVDPYCNFNKNITEVELIQRRATGPLSGVLTVGDTKVPVGNLLASYRQAIKIPTHQNRPQITFEVTSPGSQAKNSMTFECNVNPNVAIPKDTGYWLVNESGVVFPFGLADRLGGGGSNVLDIASTPTGNGYWIVSRSGAISAYGDAINLGSRPALRAGEEVTSISGTPTGKGYWLFTNLGRAINYGDAKHLGDMSNVRLNGPVVGSVPTKTGNGYWMVAKDGGIFTFGDAKFRGSTGAMRIPSPAVAMELDQDGDGYWILTQDGNIYPFAAGHYGSMAGKPLNAPVIGMTSSDTGKGYWEVASDGGVFTFGDARFAGSTGDNPPATPVRGLAAVPKKAA